MLANLTNEELFALARDGNKDAEDELFRKNSNFIHFMVKKFSNTQFPEDELFSASQFGLVKAYKTFDPMKVPGGVKFITYASRCMENEILMYLRRAKKHGNHSSLSQVINTELDGRELTLADVLHDESAQIDTNLMTEEFHKLVTTFTQSLNDKDRTVMVDYILNDGTQKQVSEKLGIAQSYVSRLAKRILRRLQTFATCNGFIENPKEVITMGKIDMPKLKYALENHPELSQKQLGEIFRVTPPAIAYAQKRFKQGKLSDINADHTFVGMFSTWNRKQTKGIKASSVNIHTADTENTKEERLLKVNLQKKPVEKLNKPTEQEVALGDVPAEFRFPTPTAMEIAIPKVVTREIAIPKVVVSKPTQFINHFHMGVENVDAQTVEQFITEMRSMYNSGMKFTISFEGVATRN